MNVTEYIETGRTDGQKHFTSDEAIARIKELLSSDKDLLNGRDIEKMSNDDLIEIGFNHYGFEYCEHHYEFEGVGDGVEYEIWKNEKTNKSYRVPIEIVRDFSSATEVTGTE